MIFFSYKVVFCQLKLTEMGQRINLVNIKPRGSKNKIDVCLQLT